MLERVRRRVKVADFLEISLRDVGIVLILICESLCELCYRFADEELYVARCLKFVLLAFHCTFGASTGGVIERNESAQLYEVCFVRDVYLILWGVNQFILYIFPVFYEG